MRRSRRRKQTAATGQHAAEAVGRRHPDYRLDHFAIVESAVTPDDQRLVRKSLQRVEYRLDEILGIVARLKNRHLLAKAGRSGPLPLERRGRDGPDHLLARRLSFNAAGATRMPQSSRKRTA